VAGSVLNVRLGFGRSGGFLGVFLIGQALKKESHGALANRGKANVIDTGVHGLAC